MNSEVEKQKTELQKNTQSIVNEFINYYYKILNDTNFEELLKFSNTSIDISDGLFADLDKLINDQKVSYKVHLNDVPISKPMR